MSFFVVGGCYETYPGSIDGKLHVNPPAYGCLETSLKYSARAKNEGEKTSTLNNVWFNQHLFRR